MWSIGCIFAEFLGRKVFLPGQSGKVMFWHRDALN